MDGFGINQLGLPSPREINAAYRSWEPSPQDFPAQEIIPDTPDEECPHSDLVSWDLLAPIAGLLPAYSGDGEMGRVTPQALKNLVMHSIKLGGYEEVMASAFEQARKPGTLNQLWGAGLVLQAQRSIWLKHQSRKEQMRWSALLGNITINVNGVNTVVSYALPNTPTAAPLWSDLVNSDPRADIETATLLFRGRTNGRPEGWMNATTANYLSQNQKFLDLLKQSPYVTLVGRDNVATVFPQLCGSVSKITVWDGGYLANDNDYTGASHVRFIPDNIFLLLAPPVLGQKIGRWVSTPSVHNGGMDAKPGPFSFVLDKLQSTKPHVLVAGGENGIVTLQFPGNTIPVTVA